MSEQKDNQARPGVSGKDKSRGSWFNTEKFHQQQKFSHELETYEEGFSQSTGQNLMGRTDWPIRKQK